MNKWLFLISPLLLIHLTITGQDVTIRKAVHFSHNSADLSVQAKSILEETAGLLTNDSLTTIRINGYTDNTGQDDYNKILSASRAEAVYRYLKERITKAGMATVSFFGSADPVDNNESESGRQNNRRVEIILTYRTIQHEEIKPEILLTAVKFDQPKQVFIADLADTIVIKAKGGTKIKIPPGSLVDRNGIARDGKIKIIIQEYLSTESMLLAGLHTEMADGTLLETGGMGNLLFFKDEDTLKINPGIPVQVSIPVSANNVKTGMEVYTSNSDTSLKWKNSGKPFVVKLASWEWPHHSHFRQISYGISQIKLENMMMGRRYREEAQVAANRKVRNGLAPINPNKTYETIITKIDSQTISLQLKARIRKWALRKNKFDSKFYDTTFIIKFDTTAYVGPLFDIKTFNCDRVYGILKEYITVRGSSNIKGGRVCALLTKSRVIIPGEDVRPGIFKLRVPKDESMIIFYTGKSQEQLYLGRKTYEFQKKNDEVVIDVAPVSESDFITLSSVKQYYSN